MTSPASTPYLRNIPVSNLIPDLKCIAKRWEKRLAIDLLYRSPHAKGILAVLQLIIVPGKIFLCVVRCRSDCAMSLSNANDMCSYARIAHQFVKELVLTYVLRVTRNDFAYAV